MNRSEQAIVVLSTFGAISIGFFILFMFGFINNKPELIIRINGGLKIILALYLIYRFNNFFPHKGLFTELDRKIVFSSAVYILLLSFADIIVKYIDVIRANSIQYKAYVYEKLGIQQPMPVTTQTTATNSTVTKSIN